MLIESDQKFYTRRQRLPLRTKLNRIFLGENTFVIHDTKAQIMDRRLFLSNFSEVRYELLNVDLITLAKNCAKSGVSL